LIEVGKQFCPLSVSSTGTCQSKAPRGELDTFIGIADLMYREYGFIKVNCRIHDNAAVPAVFQFHEHILETGRCRQACRRSRTRERKVAFGPVHNNVPAVIKSRVCFQSGDQRGKPAQEQDYFCSADIAVFEPRKCACRLVGSQKSEQLSESRYDELFPVYIHISRFDMTKKPVDVGQLIFSFTEAAHLDESQSASPQFVNGGQILPIADE